MKPEFGPNAERIGNGSLKDMTKARGHLPTVHEVAKALGKRVRYRTLPDGKREPHVSYKTNDGNGHLTREAKIVQSMMNPFWKADTARVAEQNGFPGDYGKGMIGKVLILGGVSGDFCPTCDLLETWCECFPRTGQGGKDAPKVG